MQQVLIEEETRYRELTEVEMKTMIKKLRMDAKIWLDDQFDLELLIPIKMNGRLKRTLGRFTSRRYGGESRPIKIEISKEVLQNGYDTAWEITKHELVHYALCAQGRPFFDNDYDFKETCKELNVIQPGDIIPKTKKVVAACEKCGHEFIWTKMKNNRIHKPCQGRVKFKEHRVL